MKTFLLSCALALCLAGCGGGSSGSSSSSSTSSAATPASSTGVVTQSSNTVPFTVDATYGAVNGAYVNVTICAVGTTTCTTIDHVQVDSGSVGLRILASALPTGFAQPVVSDPTTGEQLAECGEFGSGYTWGPLSKYDVTLGGETAHNLPVQIINDSFATVPSACSSLGSSMGASGTASLFAKGIVGLGVGREDCGSGCASAATDVYWVCPGTTCTESKLATTSQVSNPILGFPIDNNGMLLTLPTIASSGSAAVTGTLTFGINTQSNNQRASATLLTTDDSGDFNVVFNGASTQGFIDSGSSVYFFVDSSLGTCSLGGANWYCPTSVTQLSATLTGLTTGTLATTFSVGNAQTLLSNGHVAFNDVGVNETVFSSAVLDLGLPYFFGKSVFFGIADADTSTASGSPYVAVQ